MAKKFTQKETEQLIAGIREAYETKLRQLNYRLEGLEGENRSLRASLAERKAKEERVGRAIVQAESKGEEIKEFYRLSAETEWRTLRLFCEKWRALAAGMAVALPAAEVKKYAGFADDLAALLGRRQADLAPRAEEEKFDPKAVIEKYVEGEEESGFNLDDVLNPKGKLDLEKLCRNLGLMDD